MAVSVEAATDHPRDRTEFGRLLRVFFRFEKLLLRHWRIFLLVILLGQAHAFSLVYTASCGGRLLDTLIEGDPRWFRLWWMGSFAGNVGMVISQLLQLTAQMYLVQRVLLTMQFRLFRHVSAQSVQFHASRPIGEHMYRITQDPYSAAMMVCAAVPTIISFFQQLVTALAAARALDPRVMIALSIYLVTYILYAHWTAGIVRHFLHRQRRAAQENTAVLQESLSGIRVVLAFGRERLQRLRFFRTLADLYRRNMKYLVMNSFFGTSSRLVERSFNVVVVWFLAGWLVITDVLSVGEWFTLGLLLGNLAFSLEAVIFYIQGIRVQLVFAERMLETLDVEPAIQDLPGAVEMPPVRGRIEFRNVSFSYVPEEKVLRGVSFTVEPGSCVALVGPSGAGKSTTIGLIERFFDADTGHILIDGYDIRTVTQRSLRRRLSLAFQDALLHAGTIIDNFRYGAPHASFEEVRKVAHAVELDSFIESLENGYYTPVSEAGDLSGGQKQRLALGRALLKDAQILLLDEPTSALDSRTERAVIARLREFARGKTIVMVTHSLSSVRGADTILLFDNGRVVAQGTHEHLLVSSPLYAELWASDQKKRERDG